LPPPPLFFFDWCFDYYGALSNYALHRTYSNRFVCFIADLNALMLRSWFPHHEDERATKLSIGLTPMRGRSHLKHNTNRKMGKYSA